LKYNLDFQSHIVNKVIHPVRSIKLGDKA